MSKAKAAGYLLAKRVHKYVASHSYHNPHANIIVRSLLSACGVHNKTYSWRGSYQWARVDCRQCLKEKPPATAAKRWPGAGVEALKV